eukprot:5312802-Prymnesium_polylepis.1
MIPVYPLGIPALCKTTRLSHAPIHPAHFPPRAASSIASSLLPPAADAYLLFYAHDTELQLLRRLELQRVAIKSNTEAKSALTSARELAQGKQTISKALTLAISRSKRPSVRASRRGSAELQQLKELEIEEEEKELRARLPDYVRKLIMGYELRAYYFEII